ncbi:MAG: hypothetical protein MUC88_00855 [Planctomycetes bacterium]|jgi:hypothetical protein|nr:hypothetical protein [Planctomycetota bacterium]
MSTGKRFTSLRVLTLTLVLWTSGAQAADILFISSMDATHKAGDDALKAYMEKMGHTVTYMDDNTALATMQPAAATADVVFISESVGSGNVRDKITAVETPIVTTEAWAWDEMGLTSGAGAGQNAVTPNVDIVAPGHPLAAGLTGTVPVFSAITGTRGAARMGNGIAGDDATVIARATLTDGKTYDVVYVYEKGATLAVAPYDKSPQIAADIRICLGFDEQSYLLWNDNAYTLLKAAINYGLGTLSDPGMATKPEPADGATAVITPLFRWKASPVAVFHDIYLGKSPDLGPADKVASRAPVAMYWHLAGLEPGVTYYWRVDEIEADGVTVHQGAVWSFTTQALTAYRPSPADGAADASPTPILTWLPGLSAIKHHLYFGGDRDAVSQGAAATDKGELTEPTFAPGTLDVVATYFWRVDEIVPASPVRTGAVWSFTTCLPVDGFESYTDDEGSRIYQTWADGWTNSTGSTVGHVQAPFAERGIVHGGQQAMPLDYNNIAAPFYSDAEREFAPVQDWTINGADTLVLYVYGKTANAEAKLYVGLEDASKRIATAACPDAKVVTTPKWTTWKVPLSDFAGVNGARIKRIFLRVGDKGSTASGGTGQIYVDDIRVIKAPPTAK